ncbi:ABC transporter permease [Bifidobacterium simiarum]|uniref:ABC transporter permease n=1 Tax=Bifidobacterium simiarum TaxID=2045441 RepID=UPI001BDC867A|nr:ABC transporter permease [Bifidobacterium simiarum]MBT1166102.1 ABC transporter permease [Bifidobacterium simiarum]
MSDTNEVTASVPALKPRKKRFELPPQWKTAYGIIGVVVVAFWLIVAIIGPLLPLADPLAQTAERLAAPSGAHWFGTDELGRDVFSRVLYGARISIPVAIALVVLSMLLGGLLGMLAGYFGRVLDETIMRLADIVLAFPPIILAMVITAALGPGIGNAVIAMLVVNWPQYARIMRSMVVGVRGSEYVISDRLLGFSAWQTLRVDVLPNVVSSILVLATLDFGNAILLLSGLSFLGLGAVPPTPEWGFMVSEGVQNFSAWWIATFPGLCISSVVIAFNFIGDTLRDALDPHMRKHVQSEAM